MMTTFEDVRDFLENTDHTLVTRADAKSIAAANTHDDDEWRYETVCVNQEKDYWIVAVRDETSELVGVL